ncbi:SDR family NAD(P)-dependent oxidoreductase [Paracoccus sp. TK19116]|uniref:SDR family NAD(P)-dependent oxidoreductase n=1 Tax=Paracoccus albicereus TaxID=2922394 RepID=A0ABT1MWW4_9RHOB|nr:SDR family NAD(P)-dependent oxidoreductase [Paracoccus albicereus]MCQ0972006.1 SDR family NAD(P)-dependent oxidoreductase [Paracoccus albicereus]
MSRRNVLITGAGSGIGRALAMQADRHGHRVILVGRREESLARTAVDLRDALVLPADVTTAQGRAAIVAGVCETGLDILIHNAGTVPSGTLEAMSDDDIAALLALNVAAPLALTRDLLAPLTASRGQVVMVGSVFGEIAFPYFAAYSASKFALRGMADALRRELAPRGIAVTHLAPRGTRTDAAQGFDALVRPMAMTLDDPEAVAARAWRAIVARRPSQVPASRERLFIALQRLRPALIDRALIRLARDPAVVAAARPEISRP